MGRLNSRVFFPRRISQASYNVLAETNDLKHQPVFIPPFKLREMKLEIFAVLATVS